MTNEDSCFSFRALARRALFGLLVAVFLAGIGCDTAGGYYGTAGEVRDANAGAKHGFAGAAKTAPAVTATVTGNARWLCVAGSVAFLAGCIASGNAATASFAAGLTIGGAALLVTSFVLPLYCGWIALGFGAFVVVGTVKTFWPNHKTDGATALPVNQTVMT